MGNKLEEIAIQYRDLLTTKNTFNNSADANNYGETHTRALSDEATPVHGKGTGVFLDTYNGGGSLDIYGSQNAVGSGRIANKAKNEYNENKPYEHPDTSGNIGQFRFH